MACWTGESSTTVTCTICCSTDWPPRRSTHGPPVTATAALRVTSPYTGELVGEAPVADRTQVTAALDAAAASGGRSSRHERAQVLFAVAERLLEQRGELARLISLESGLCLKDTAHEVNRAVDVFRFAAMEALRDDGETFAGDVS